MNEKQQMTTTLLQVPDFGQAHTDCGLVKLTTSAQTWHKPGTEVQQNKLDLWINNKRKTNIEIKRKKTYKQTATTKWKVPCF